MKIGHEVINNRGKKITYIYVEIIDDMEFAKEFLSKDEKETFFSNLKKYVIKFFNNDDVAVLVVNGILIGTVSLGIFFANENNTQTTVKTNETEISSIYKKIEDKNDESSNIEVLDTAKITNEETVTENKQSIVKPVENAKPSPTPNNPVKPVNNEIKIKLNTNGNIATINLEEYVIGVVASEMPASFNLEALKSQAIAARTFAMKKHSQGITLLNSTAHQVYKNNSQLKSMWGSSYNTYYNKIKSAVSSTKGLVLKYNGKYIDALYHSMSNGKTELPKYVWGSSYSYLQSVNSSWDRNVKGYETSKNIPYSQASKKLGITMNNQVEITVLGRTVSNRVDSIKIGNKTFSGVKVRELLGLRSTDFTISKTADGILVTTKGYGHGVGMSQYRC